MPYFQNRDQYPMTSREAMALQASVSIGQASHRNSGDNNNGTVALTNDDNDNDRYSTENSSSASSFSGRYYDCDNDVFVPLDEIVWSDMETSTMNRGPSDATLSRLRGGGIASDDTNAFVVGTGTINRSLELDSAPAAVLDDTDIMERNRNRNGKNVRDNEDGGNYDDDDNDDDEDIFLDRPAYESRRHGPVGRVLIQLGRWCEKIVHRLYGDTLSIDEFIRTLTLASTLFCMIGGYWLMRSLKDPVITALCGVTVIPKAKIVSVFVVLGVVSVYNHLLDTDIPKHKLFYLFGTFYFILFTFIGAMLFHPTYGLANEQPNPNRILGWVSYCAIESFGSVMVTLFWSFANSNISLETAKASYGLMVATAQVGSIMGPTFVTVFVRIIGVPACYMIGSISMLLLQVTMYMYVTIYGTTDNNNKRTSKTALLPSSTSTSTSTSTPPQPKKKEKAGILEGLKLLYVHNYVKGIFAISCLFMVEVTILDYTMKVLARDYFAVEYPCVEGSCYNPDTGVHGLSQEALKEFASFMGLFGQSTNMLSFTLSLFGTSAVLRYLGLRLTLLLFPSLCLGVIIFVRMYPTLYVVFGAMMILKANSYALNNPTKEILYQPTNSAIKYKAKSWIDIFGDRVAKATGSLITNAFSNSTDSLIANGSLVGIAVATFLVWNATFMGRKFDEYTTTGYVVGGDNSHIMTSCTDNGDGGVTHIAIQQNNTSDTSCAIIDEQAAAEADARRQQEVEANITVELEEEGVGKDFAKKPDVVLV